MKKQLFLFGLLAVAGSAWAQSHEQQLAITQSVASGTTVDQKAVSTILASNRVSQGATAVYTAGQSVTLQPGFVAQAGSVFTALIAPVNGGKICFGGTRFIASAYPNPFVEKNHGRIHPAWFG